MTGTWKINALHPGNIADPGAEDGGCEYSFDKPETIEYPPFARIDTTSPDGKELDVSVIPQPNGTVRIVVTGDPGDSTDFEVIDDR